MNRPPAHGECGTPSEAEHRETDRRMRYIFGSKHFCRNPPCKIGRRLSAICLRSLSARLEAVWCGLPQRAEIGRESRTCKRWHVQVLSREDVSWRPADGSTRADHRVCSVGSRVLCPFLCLKGKGCENPAALQHTAADCSSRAPECLAAGLPVAVSHANEYNLHLLPCTP